MEQNYLICARSNVTPNLLLLRKGTFLTNDLDGNYINFTNFLKKIIYKNIVLINNGKQKNSLLRWWCLWRIVIDDEADADDDVVDDNDDEYSDDDDDDKRGHVCQSVH